MLFTREKYIKIFRLFVCCCFFALFSFVFDFFFVSCFVLFFFFFEQLRQRGVEKKTYGEENRRMSLFYCKLVEFRKSVERVIWFTLKVW